MLNKHNVKSTFFSTFIFAKENQNLIKQLLDEGHELASHTWFHSDFKVEHLQESREELQMLFNTKVSGLRRPRMAADEVNNVLNAESDYNPYVHHTSLRGGTEK